VDVLAEEKVSATLKHWQLPQTNEF
jgi:hypothetical protein